MRFCYYQIFLVLSFAVLILACKGKDKSDSTVNSMADPTDLLLDRVQFETFKYFWDGAEIHSGMARERFHMDEPDVDAHIVTTGGSGFGLMALLVGIERGFITREEGLGRFEKIIRLDDQR